VVGTPAGTHDAGRPGGISSIGTGAADEDVGDGVVEDGGGLTVDMFGPGSPLVQAVAAPSTNMPTTDIRPKRICRSMPASDSRADTEPSGCG
jgi:hypothetical protein